MKQRINLVPQQPLAVRLKKVTPLIIGALVAVVCLIVFLIGQSVEKENRNLKKSIGALEARQNKLQQQQASIAQLSEKITQMEVEEKRLRKVVSHLETISSRKQRFSELLYGIATVLPDTVRCEQISFNESGGEIVGQATVYDDLPTFVSRLNQLPRFHSGFLHVLSQKDGEEMDILTFTVVFQLQRQR